MFCPNCGIELPDGSKRCTECGEVLEHKVTIDDGIQDEGGFLWGLLGCCIPIAGLILYLVWKDSKPKTAKAVGKGALLCVILVAVYYVLIFVVGLGAAIFYGNAATL